MKKTVFLLLLFLNLLPGIRSGGLTIGSGFEAKAQSYANEAPATCAHVEEKNVVLNSSTCYETYDHCYYDIDCTTGRIIEFQGCQSMSRLNQACSRTTNIADCSGVPGGFAYTDGCGQCVGGNTGRTSSCVQGTTTQDCMGVVGGTAYTDNCGNCVGGTTGRQPCSSGSGGGGGGGGNGNESTPKPAVDVLDKSKWAPQDPNRCKDACDAYLRRTGLTDVGSKGCVYRLTYQDQGGNGDTHSYGDPSTSLNTVVDVIDRHLDEGRGITVGLNYRINSSNADGTDHFVVITGRGHDTSRNEDYYTYMDPGRSNADIGCSTSANRLYVDGNLIHGTRQGKDNTITHIRPNDGDCSGSTTY
ncbi:MAG: hypothetical protein Q8909_04460 [Bacteroidota bacterium]|nr:hypothetical protein [Bacteroidota bacterium]